MRSPSTTLKPLPEPRSSKPPAALEPSLRMATSETPRVTLDWMSTLPPSWNVAPPPAMANVRPEPTARSLGVGVVERDLEVEEVGVDLGGLATGGGNDAVDRGARSAGVADAVGGRGGAVRVAGRSIGGREVVSGEAVHAATLLGVIDDLDGDVLVRAELGGLKTDTGTRDAGGHAEHVAEGVDGVWICATVVPEAKLNSRVPLEPAISTTKVGWHRRLRLHHRDRAQHTEAQERTCLLGRLGDQGRRRRAVAFELGTVDAEVIDTGGTAGDSEVEVTVQELGARNEVWSATRSIVWRIESI